MKKPVKYLFEDYSLFNITILTDQFSGFFPGNR